MEVVRPNSQLVFKDPGGFRVTINENKTANISLADCLSISNVTVVGQRPANPCSSVRVVKHQSKYYVITGETALGGGACCGKNPSSSHRTGGTSAMASQGERKFLGDKKTQQDSISLAKRIVKECKTGKLTEGSLSNLEKVPLKQLRDVWPLFTLIEEAIKEEKFWGSPLIYRKRYRLFAMLRRLYFFYIIQGDRDTIPFAEMVPHILDTLELIQSRLKNTMKEFPENGLLAEVTILNEFLRTIPDQKTWWKSFCDSNAHVFSVYADRKSFNLSLDIRSAYSKPLVKDASDIYTLLLLDQAFYSDAPVAAGIMTQLLSLKHANWTGLYSSLFGVEHMLLFQRQTAQRIQDLEGLLNRIKGPKVGREAVREGVAGCLILLKCRESQNLLTEIEAMNMDYETLKNTAIFLDSYSQRKKIKPDENTLAFYTQAQRIDPSGNKGPHRLCLYPPIIQAVKSSALSNLHNSNYLEALNSLEETQQLELALYGAEAVPVAETLLFKGKVKRKMNRFDDAIDHYEAAMALFLGGHPSSQAYPGIVSYETAKLYRSQGEPDKSLAVIKDSLDNASAVPSEEVASKLHLLKGSILTGREGRAELKKAITLSRNFESPNHKVAAKGTCLLGDSYNYENNPEEATRHYTEALAQAERTNPPPLQLLADIRFKLGVLFQSARSYEESLKHFKASLKHTVSARGENHSAVYPIYERIGDVQCHRKKKQDSLDSYLKTLKIEKSVLEATHPDILGTLHKIGIAQAKQKDYKEALKSFNKELKSWKSLGQNKDVAVVDVYRRIGENNGKIMEFGTGIAALNKAYEIEHSHHSDPNKVKLKILDELAKLQSKNGDVTEAISTYEQAIEECDQLSPPDYKESSKLSKDIASFYRSKSDFEKSIDYYKRAIDCENEVYRDAHAVKALTLYKLAFTYYKAGDLDEALSLAHKAASMSRECDGDANRTHGYCLLLLGTTYDSKNDLQKALEYFKHSVEVNKQLGNSMRRSLAESEYNLGCVYYKLKDYDSSLKHHQRAVEIREQVLPAGHTELVHSLNNLALLYDIKEAREEAMEYLERALEAKQRAGGNDAETALIFGNLGLVCDAEGQYAKALEYENQCLSIRRDQLGLAHPDTQLTIKTIEVLSMHQSRLATLGEATIK